MNGRIANNYAICLALAMLMTLALGCETPVNDDRRANIDDPKSEIYQLREIKGIQITAEATGSITIKWEKSPSAVDEYLVEKSLGNDSSYVEVGRVPESVNQFSDNSGEVRGETHYRITSYYNDGGEKIIIDQSSARLTFGTLNRIDYEFLESEKKLKINWETTHPLFTHYEIYSSNNISGVSGTPVRIESGSTSASFIDELTDITFSARDYSIIALIERDGFRDEIAETDFRFNPRELFRPGNLAVSFLNEQDWELSWTDLSFFLDGYVLTRTIGGVVEEFDLPATGREFRDSVLVFLEPLEVDENRLRRYMLEGYVDNQRSDPIYLDTGLFIPNPILDINDHQNSDPNSIRIDWEFSDEQFYNLVKEFVVERALESDFELGEFSKIASLTPDTRSYTDSNVSPDQTYFYRIRTKTSTVDYAISTAYGQAFEISGILNKPGNDEISAMEISPDGNYVAVLEGLPIYTSGIDIYDLNNLQYLSSIKTQAEDVISSFKISPDGNTIYFSLPNSSKIMKSDFPSGNNQEIVIENARYDSESESGESTGIRSIDISSDGKYLVGLGGRGYIIKYDVSNGERVLDYKNYDGGTTYWGPNPAFSPNGDFIAGSSRGLYLLNSETAALEQEFSFVTPNFVHTGFSINSRFLYTSRYSSNSSIFDLNSGYSVHTFPGPASAHPRVESTFLTGSLIIDIEERRIIGALSNFSELERFRDIYSSVYLSESKILMGLFGTIELWETNDVDSWYPIRSKYVGR